MPSLKALEEFKSSFSRIGNEDQIRSARDLPPDDLPLPDREPAVLPSVSPAASSDASPAGTEDFSPADSGAPDSDFMDFGDLGDLVGTLGPNPDLDSPAEETPTPSGADADFNGFLDDIPDDFAVEEIDASPGEAPAEPADDFGFPDSLLDGLAGELESEQAALEDSGENGGVPEAAEDVPAELSAFEELPVLEAEAVSGETAPEPDDPEAEDDLDLSFPEGESGFDLGGESLDPGAATTAEGGDSFDNFNLDNDALAADFNLGGGLDAGDTAVDGLGNDFASLEEFSLPGIDDTFGGRTPGAAPGRQTGAGQPVPVDEGEMFGEVEEIQLSDAECSRLMETLVAYPLNLRIACEELIAEEAVAPDLMSNLIKLLVRGAPPKETAVLAGKILGRTILIPKGFEKKTGEELEAEQASFAYIFIHNFLPVLRLFLGIATVAVSLGYLAWNFIITPVRAEKIYRLGYERIFASEYSRANDRFQEAFRIHQKKDWFYKYAEAFRDERQYIHAARMYGSLLNYTAAKNKKHIPEKKAVLDYAALETYYLRDYETAGDLLRRHILDYAPFDRDALLALGDNSLAWGETEKERLEDARESYAKLLERYGQTDPVLERMLKYFIRTDNLGEVLSLKTYFMNSEKRKISAPALAELGGYLLDKRTEEVRGVPNEYLDRIEGMREVLLRSVRTDPLLPESYYHLARYYEYFENPGDERLTLERANAVFDAAREETPKRLYYRIDTLRRYAGVLIKSREFFPAEEQVIKGINLYEDGLSRRLLNASPEFGRLYANLGDLEYFVKDGDMSAALDYYQRSRNNGYAPPEMLYRMGAARYQLRQWSEALDLFFASSSAMPFNRRILYALGNVSYLRGNYYAAQGYYDRLLEILEADRSRFPLIMPTDNEEQLELAERLMVAQNNLGVALEALTGRTGNNSYRSRAMGLYTDSERAWDVMTRNPQSMIRMSPSPDTAAPGVNPAYLNIQNSIHPVSGYEPQFFMHIDKDILEPSAWEELAPPGFRLSEGVPGR
ncbi:MAG: tetratricopeptide repeat protein [Treponema sp.]|jgi:tetratricopeptide (TPR) repeat protein|nr:tetratricopeptide repeat protein [Treponema sp.]